MDALELLRQMHVDAKETFRDLQQASPEQRGALWAKLRPEIVVHEQIEERIIYGPAMKDLSERDPRMADWDRRHRQMVEQASTLMQQLSRTDTSDPGFLDTIARLEQALLQHIEEEETSAWPYLRQAWGQDKLERASGKVQAARTMAAGGATVSGTFGPASESSSEPGSWASR